MFSKSLFKQSCKANGVMWAVITFAVCFMLACVMLISGSSTLSESKNSFQNTIIEGELTSQLQSRALNYYVTSDVAFEQLDKIYIEESKRVSEINLDEDQQFLGFKQMFRKKFYDSLIASGVPKETANVDADEAVSGENLLELKKDYVEKQISMSVLTRFTSYINTLIEEKGYKPDSQEALEIQGLILTIWNPDIKPIPGVEQTQILHDLMIELRKTYTDNGETLPLYEYPDKNEITYYLTNGNKFSKERIEYRDIYTAENSSIFMAGNMIKDENVNMILKELSSYGVTLEEYKGFGLKDYRKVKDIATGALINFRANYAYRVEHMQDNETEESIALELSKDVSKSLLSSLPEEISQALNELGQADLYGTLVGSIFFKMAGLLLPIIYMIMTSNSLIAGQVDSGSMAYILSTSTKRRTVTTTQAIYLVGSLFAMFSLTTITSMICFSLVDVETSLTYGKLALINLGAFIVMFAMSGICFLTSCWFNRSKRSMAIGGGITMFFLVATMLGLFGSSVLPSLVRMEALNTFNYVSIISLFDVISILEGGFSYIWKFAILIGIGAICYIVGSEKFAKKDLPL